VSDPLSLPEQTETALDATLLVRVPEGIGSAVLISPDGFALTAAHVVGSHDRVDLVAHSGDALTAVVVRVDEVQDVALLKVDLPGTASCLAVVTGRAALGSDVFILGSPAGEELSFSVAKGIVSGYRSIEGVQFVQLDAALNPGNSGGPVVATDGTVVAIASWKVSHVSMEGLGFGVPADVALAALDVEMGDSSSDDWADRKGRRGGAPPVTATAEMPEPAPDDYESVDRRRKALRTGLIVPGAIGLGVGVTLVAATGGYYYATPRMSRGTW
jgi:S1-C subfamily serine protease